MKQIILWIRKYNGDRKLHIVIENNASMKNANKGIITEQLQTCFEYPIYLTVLNGSSFGVQTRRRLFWTTFELDVSKIVCDQTWNDVLVNIDDVHGLCLSEHRIVSGNVNKIFQVKCDNRCLVRYDGENLCSTQIVENDDGIGQSNYMINKPSHTNLIKCNPITRNPNRLNNTLVDHRIGSPTQFIIRYYSTVELERLFWFPDGWVSSICSKTRSYKLLGNTIIVKIVEFIGLEFKDKILPVDIRGI